VGEARPRLRLLLLTGQRPGEVATMQAAHMVVGWWQMPGKPQSNWPGTKNGRDHRVALGSVQNLSHIHHATASVSDICC
jgi:hypothetical protein